MKEATPSDQAQDTLAHHLKRAQAAQQQLTEYKELHERQIKALVECLHHLSINCKGQNLELDNRLAKLRTQLADNPDIDSILPELTNLCRALQNQYQLTQREIGTSQQALQSLARRLGQLAELPDQFQRELHFFQQDVQKPVHTLWEFLPQMTRLVGYYESLLKERMASEEPLAITPRHRQLAHELAQLLSEIDFRNESRDMIAAIKAELAGEISAEQLLEAYQQVLTLLMADIAKEKSASQQFLFALNDALGAVREAVAENWNQSLRNFGHQREFHRQLSTHCMEFGDSVRAATELDQLKSLVANELGTIRELLRKRDEEETREFARLKGSMEKMRKELTALASEASGYKDQLIEQQRLNMLDALTQLPNRAALDERLKREYRNVRRYGNDLWVAVADIDHFKGINDSFGHTTGDKTLQVVAMALKNSLRKGEFVARYGGEEFVLLLPDVSAEQVGQILNRTRERIKAIPFKFRNEKLSITISIGAALVTGNETMQETFERADAALYRAKRKGRDRVEIDS
ncbi:GGDEF domain-containing protein [Ferrimonas balearica]|uniref:GGDEF domain-containing protein n=1 Tax=Ferrimonas balearica TaxID=44012 RepID=UPI001C57602C|nr:GGDEF domain-containing protein [Ferrimonas balearica]MBW3139998.1 diguanylate cyclase [Ferrimonas balearica]MBW3165022.1 diguanylate cyclase [Ferrimonas balearica]MBY5980111.1 diguanylate cyclase [Ferrimonas balearica]MBY6106894.1 diguanylate cyclase [Ferrimonas balearica]MBY6224549.1 diguanylate cyclase [Ferrimonas balearica]